MKMVVYKLYIKNIERREWIILSMVLSIMMKKLLRISISLFIGINWKIYLQEKETIKPNIDTSKGKVR